MLVLSRRENEKILFPEVGVSVEVLQVKGNRARIGIDAPASMSIIRGELARRGQELADAVDATSEAAGPTNRQLHKALAAAADGLKNFRVLLEKGQVLEAEATYRHVLEVLCHPETATSQPAAVRQPSEAAEEGHPPKEHRALLVEDDANESELLAGYLRLSGFEVATADDGQTALNYLQENDRPDCVLVDMIMPRCDGPTTVNAIRGDRRYDGMKVFAVSGTSPTAFGLETGISGVDRWFQKPVNPELLVDQLSLELSCGPEAA